MAEEKESNLVDEIVGTTEESKEEKAFDASAFVGYEKEKKGNALDKEALDEKPEEVPVSESEDNTESEGETESEGDFSWDSVKTDTEVVKEVDDNKAEEKTEEDDDWDEAEEVKAEEKETPKEDFNWAELGEEVGVKAENKEELIAQMKEALKPPVDDNKVITQLKDYLSLSDRDLVVADMRASQYSDEDIEDTIDRMEDAGLLKREATLVRNQITKHIHTEKDRLRAEKENSEKQKKQDSTKQRKDLQKFIKDKEDFFGGKVSQNEKKNLYNYIIKGNFAEDIFSNHANVADAAFLWQNKDKIFKMIKTQGVEQGKSSILNGITSPSANNRNSKNFEPVSSKFNPDAFLRK